MAHKIVLIPFLAGLLFGRKAEVKGRGEIRLNPLFGGSAFRTAPFSRRLSHEPS